jgi:hypothetical protein
MQLPLLVIVSSSSTSLYEEVLRKTLLTSDIEFARREAGGVRAFPSPVAAILERAPVVVQFSNEKRLGKFLSASLHTRKPLLTSELVSIVPKIPGKTGRAPKPVKKPATKPATNLARATDSATVSASAPVTDSATVSASATVTDSASATATDSATDSASATATVSASA